MGKLTDSERREVRELGRRGRSGILRPGDQERCFDLHTKDPDGYREEYLIGRNEADASVNPLAKGNEK